MKKLLSSLLLLTLFITSMFITGCRSDNKTGAAGSQSGGASYVEGETFSRGEVVRILVNGEIPDRISELQSSLYSALGEFPVLITDESQAKGSELIIGTSERALAKKAEELMNREEREGTYLPRYAIYSDGESVAIVYDSCDGYDDYILETVINRFIEEFVKPSSGITIKKTDSIFDTIDILAYQEELDEAMLEAEWAYLKQSVMQRTESEEDADAIVKAFQDLYTMYSDKMLNWLADLYCPETGGFYITNSARDNEGYLPNIESTSQAMDILRLSGMIKSYDNDLSEALPEWFKNQMIAFVKGLQDPNGYFYHPQYTREQTDTHVAKKERDLTKGLDLLASLGASPTYDTPNDVKGDGILADGTPVSYITYNDLTFPLEESVASAVSRVVAVSDDESYTDSSSPHLASEEAFRSYLKSLEATIRSDPYTVGNDFASQASTIYSKGYGQILADWLDSMRYESTGHWYHLNDYMGINGLMKISAAYNGINRPLPEPERMAMFAIDMITTDEEEVTVCYAYNTWFTVNNVLNNLKRNVDYFGQSEVDRITENIMTRLYENAPELIAATHEKQLKFLLEDGSFQYDFGVGGTSQGLPASVPNTTEGGVNPTLICMSETVAQISAALGVDRVSIYTRSDFLRFIERLEGLGSIVKATEKPIKESATFDSETVGRTTYEVNCTGTSTSTYTVIEDPREGARPDAKVLKFEAKADGTKSVMLPFDVSNNATYQCYVFEGEYCFIEVPTGGFAYLDMGTECYMLTFKGYNDDPEAKTATSIGIFEQSNADGSLTREMDLGLNFAIGEWFKIRIEYYVEDTTAPRVKLYVNDTLITVSGNTYDKTGGRLNGEIIKPKTRYEGTNFLVYSYYGATVLMDNLYCYKIRDTYTPLTEEDVQPTRYNVDAPDSSRYVYDFEEDEIGSAPDLITSSGASVAGDEEDQYLLLGSGAKSDVIFPINIMTQNTNCAVFEAYITIESGSAGKEMTFAFTEEARDPNALSKFNIKVENGVAHIYNAPTGTSADIVAGVEIPVGEEFLFRAEYFDIYKITLFYINGELIASSDAATERAYRYSAERATLSVPNGMNVRVDDAVCERIIKDFEETTRPAVDSKIYDFTTSLGDITSTGNVTVSGGYLNLGSGASVLIPVNQRSVISTSFFFDAEIPASTISSGNRFTLNFFDKNGNIILSYTFIVTDSQINMYETTERKTYEDPLYIFTKSAKLKFGISYYSGKGLVYVTANSNAVAASNLVYSTENSLVPVSYAVVESIQGSELKLDNLKFESYNATFTAMDVTEAKNPDDSKEVLDYEGSSTGNTPSLIASDTKSVGSGLSVKELLGRDKEITKALLFTTKSGYNDKIVFSLTKTAQIYNCTVVETDFKFTFTGDGSQTSFQFFLESGSDIAYAINMNKSGDLLKFKPMLLANGDNTGSLEYKEVAGAESWHRMKIEYYYGTRSTVRIKLYIDETLLFEDDSFYTKLYTSTSPIKSITDFRIFTYSSTDAILTLDNTSFMRISKDYEAGDEYNPIITNAAVLPVYGGADSIIVLVHDDGHLPSATLIDKLLRKYGLEGNVAITAKRFLEENYDQEEVDMWQAFLDTGRWGMINHSMTHSFWGDATTGEVDAGLIAYEVIESRKLLQEIFPTENFYVYAYPGISSVTNKFTESVYDEVKEVVMANYLAGRYYGSGSASLYSWDWEWMPTYAITLDQQSSLSAIDTAVNNGLFMSILVHQVVEDYKIDNDIFIREDFSENDPFWSRESHIEAICERIAEYVEEGKVWSAKYEDAVLYLYEAENTALTVNRTSQSIFLNVDDGLDDEIFNFPLSVKVVVDSSWEAVKVTQGDRVTYAETFTENGLTYAIVDVIPDTTDAIVTSAELTDIPEEPEAPATPETEEGTSTPPSVSDDDEINMGDGSVTEDDGWT